MLRDRQQKRGAAKIKTPLRLGLPIGRQAPLRLCVNKKKDYLPVRRGGLDRQQRRGAAKKLNG